MKQEKCFCKTEKTTRVSRHHGGLIEDPLKSLLASHQYLIIGFKGSPN